MTELPTNNKTNADGARARRMQLFESILGPETARLLNMARILRDASVADIGCGEGAVTLLLSKMVGPLGRVYAIDGDGGALDRLKVRASTAGCKNIVPIHAGIDEALTHIPEVSVAYSRFFLMHVSRPRVVLTHVREKLLPGGRLVIEEPLIAETAEYPRSGLWDPPIALYESLCRLRSVNPNFGRSVLEEARKAGFEIDENFRYRATMSPAAAREYICCTLVSSRDAYIGSGVIDERGFCRLLRQIENLDLAKIEHCSFHAVTQAICSPMEVSKGPWEPA